jgi:hypothetical protein
MHIASRLSLVVRHGAVLIAGGAVLLAVSGCYKRVVGAEGVGADRYDVYEPNLKEPDDSVNPKRQAVPTKTVPTQRAPG